MLMRVKKATHVDTQGFMTLRGLRFVKHGAPVCSALVVRGASIGQTSGVLSQSPAEARVYRLETWKGSKNQRDQASEILDSFPG